MAPVYDSIILQQQRINLLNVQIPKKISRVKILLPLQIELVSYMSNLCSTTIKYKHLKKNVGVGFLKPATQLRDGYYYGADLIMKMAKALLVGSTDETTVALAKNFYYAANQMYQEGTELYYEAINQLRPVPK